ncbi:hypothetical protein ACQKWADRAFT_124721 [Trichoderma austrokoningii]
MCVHFHSWNRCSSCLITFNRRLNRVPCWNGAISRWRIHHHGLSCRNGRYERAPDEVYTHRCCGRCSLEAAKRADEKSGTATEAATSETRTMLGSRGQSIGRFVAATTRRATAVKRMLMRCWALKALCGRGKQRGHVRGRIWMLGY